MKLLLQVFLLCLLALPSAAKEKLYRHPETGLLFPPQLSWKKPAVALDRERPESLGEGHVCVAYTAERLTISAYLYPPDLSLDEDFAYCQGVLSTSVLSRQTLLEKGPCKSTRWPQAQQATYRCSGLTAYAKFTQLVMFEVGKSRLKLRVSCDRDPRPITRLFLDSIHR